MLELIMKSFRTTFPQQHGECFRTLQNLAYTKPRPVASTLLGFAYIYMRSQSIYPYYIDSAHLLGMCRIQGKQ